MIELMAEVSEFFLLESELEPLETELKAKGAGVDSTSVMQMIQQAISRRNLDTWYGCYFTRLRNPDVLDNLNTNIDPLADIVDHNLTAKIKANRATRLAWTESDHEVLLFINGEYYVFRSADHPWIVDFCERRVFRLNTFNETQVEMTRELLGTGAAQLI